jgi:predicted Zn-dependent protease
VPGHYEAAVAEAQKSIDIDPDFAFGYYGLAIDNTYLGRISEAENILRRAAGRDLDIDEFIMLEYDIAFLKGDQAAIERAANRGRQRSAADNWISGREANLSAYFGHLQRARSLTERAATQALEAGQPERSGLWQAGAAVREALFGNRPEAIRRANAALEFSKDREVEYGAALAFSLSGQVTTAEQLANDLAKRFPEDTSVKFSYLPVIRAEIALNRKEPTKALEMLQAAAPNELGAPRSSIHALFGALYPVYVRGEAYLAQGRGTEAVLEFQKIIDHRGIVVNDPIGALARLQLARAYASSRNWPNSDSSYKDFLALWNDADPDIPLLKQARVELAELRRSTPK